MTTNQEEIERQLRILISYAWDGEVAFESITTWLDNFNGVILDKDLERLLALFSISRFLYFSRRMVREMLRSLYRDYFRAPIMQRIRRNYSNTRDYNLLLHLYEAEKKGTRFIGVGNPSESGAHLLYYFRQVNRLEKDLFIDISAAFEPVIERDRNGIAEIKLKASSLDVSRYVFFDDLVGSGDQVSLYLEKKISMLRKDNPDIELKYLCLFGTKNGIARLNGPSLFAGNASCLFELDDSYKAFHDQSRNFSNCPSWFVKADFEKMARGYGSALKPECEAGHRDGQLMIGFSHNTPDNSLPIFWDEGQGKPWAPVFIRFDKNYG